MITGESDCANDSWFGFAHDAEHLGVSRIRSAGGGAGCAHCVPLLDELCAPGRVIRLEEAEPRSHHHYVRGPDCGDQRVGGTTPWSSVILTVGLLGGLLSKRIGFNTGVQFMGYYTAVLTVPALLKLIGG